MLFDALLQFMITHWPWLLVVAFFLRCIHLRYFAGLRRFNGPFLASLVSLWGVWDAWTDYERPPLVHLHKKYGDIVRIGPKRLSIGHPDAVKDMFGPGKDFRKSGFYFVSAATSSGQATPSLFSTLDKSYHDNIRRSVNQAFSLTSLVNYEPFVNKVIDVLLHQLRSRFADKTGDDGIVDLPKWLHFYSTDVIGEVVYGKSYGFLTTGEDLDSMLKDTQCMLDYAYLAGQAPWLDKLFLKNPVRLWLGGRGWLNSTNPAVVSALKVQTPRLQKDAETKQKVESEHEDLLEKFIKAKHDHPDIITNKEILMLGLSMVFAGSDTTAWTLSAFFYYLLKHPSCFNRLKQEIRGHSTDVIIPFTTSQKLPYLDACIKETFRLHPAARFGSERVVPTDGAVICGEFIPGGTIVTVNAWVLHRRKEIFGEDVEQYRPERWLEDEEKTKEMNKTLFQFGSGNFSCIGKNIASMEVYKVVPALLNAFEIELVHPDKPWKLLSGSFARPSDVDVRLSTRSVQ